MKIKTFGWIQVVLLLAGFAVVAKLQAQSAGGTFTGEVRDTTGAVVPKADVSIKNVATEVVTTYTTTGQGVYFAPSLVPGSYLITAKKNGFRQEVVGPVTLDVAQTVRVNLALSVGSVSETMVVKATGTELLQTETGDVSQVIGSTEISQIPLNGRSYLQLGMLSGGVAEAAPGTTGNPTFIVNGQRGEGNQFIIDGMVSSNTLQGRGPQLTVPLDAVQEFSLQENSFSAEYGDVAGGVVSVQVKSGTNDWHGSSFDYLRNSALDATNYFSKYLSQPKNFLIQSDFGGSVGGPIKHNKTFFFTDYEGVRGASSNPMVGTVPLASERAGDFTAAGLPGAATSTGVVPIYDPTTNLGTLVPGVAVFRSQYVYNGVLNVIPPGQINSSAAAMMAALPLPNQFSSPGIPLMANNYAHTSKVPTSNDSADVRIDNSFSARHTLFGRYSYRRNASTTPSLFGKPIYGGGQTTSGWNHDVVIGDTFSIRPNLLNQFQFNYDHSFGGSFPLDYGTNSATAFGIPNINVSQFTTGLPTFAVSGISSIGDSPGFPNSGLMTRWILSEKVIRTFGKQTMIIGGDVTLESELLTIVILGRDEFVYAPQTTGTAINPMSGNAVAAFMAGFPMVFVRDTPEVTTQDAHLYAMYFQDDYKVTPRLTVNLGGRYDLMPPVTQPSNHQANFNPATLQMELAGVGGIPRGLVQTDRLNFGPRVGLTYALTKDSKTIVRSGFGMAFIDSYGEQGPGAGPVLNPPFYTRVQTVNGNSPYLVPQYATNSTLPALALQDPAHPLGDIRYVPKNSRNAYSETWNLGVQRALSNSMFLDVSYLGTHGVRLLEPININDGAPAPLASGTPESRQPYGTALGLIQTLPQEGSSNYHALVAKVEKKYSMGLYFRGAYTWSKSLDENSSGTDSNAASSENAQDPNNVKGEYGRSAFDVPQRFVFSGVWNIPYGRGRRFGGSAPAVIDWVLGDWQFGGIESLQTGTPITAVLSCTDVNGGTNGNYCRPNQIANPNLPADKRTIDRWFDTTAEVIPNPFGYGNERRNTISMPGSKNTDLSFAKYFHWGRDAAKRVQFRGELFNAFNNVNFGPPNPSLDAGAAEGTIRSAGSARLIQFALRIEF